METVAIFGVGLIGGSFALALRKAGFSGRILGVSSPETIRQARELGVIDEGVSLEEAAARADLLYLAQPILRILELIPQLSGRIREGALVTDAGSTKLSIVRQALRFLPRDAFLGGHPMAGKEIRGVAAAGPDLFDSNIYVLTPSNPHDLETEAAKTLLGWLAAFGVNLLILDAGEHDRAVAWTSHLPQLASTALGVCLEQAAAGVEWRASGPGLLSMLRLANSNFAIWDDIIATNEPFIGAALDAYIAVLRDVRAKLGSSELGVSFNHARAFAKSYSDLRKQP